MAHIYKGILPFVLLQIVGIIILVFVPELVTWLPGSWTKKGAHRMIQVRIATLNNELRDSFCSWYPAMKENIDESFLFAA